MKLRMTKHAQKRLQQRGIPEDTVDLLLDFGTSEHDNHGGEIIFFNKRCRKKLERVLGFNRARKLEKKLDAYLVLSGTEIVTVGWRYQRITHH